MAIINGVCKCAKCNKDIAWDYHIPNQMSDYGSYEVETYNVNVVHGTRINNFSSPEIELRIMCKHCNTCNIFTYRTNDK